MDDQTLAPFVDALASALIMMVLVAVFFLLQSMSSIAASAKLYTVSIDKNVKQFSPIVFHKPLKVDLDKNELLYVLNFELELDDIKAIRNEILAAKKEVKVIVKSDDIEKKVMVNLLRFLHQIDLPKEQKVKTVFAKSNSTISKIIWEF